MDKRVFFNGVYWYCSKASNERTNMTAKEYFRFFENGTVLSVSTPATIEQLKNWFNEEGDSDRGTFVIDGDTISFQIVCKGPFGVVGTIDYVGVIINDKLVINKHSNINGFGSKDMEFLFSTW